MKNLYLFVCFCLSAFVCQSVDSLKVSNIEVSVLTCGSGNELYSLFGHTAIRVTNKSQNIDIVYNYGTFNFGDPKFYTKFVQGQLDYFLSVDQFSDFIYSYQYEKRTVWEQKLDLTDEEATVLVQFLEWNKVPQNRMYAYDYFHDNCTTRASDALFDHLGTQVMYNYNWYEGNESFRSYINKKLIYQPWSKLGIDLLLGAVIDQPISGKETHFLPELFMKTLRETSINGHPLVKEQSILFKGIDVFDEPGILEKPSFYSFCLFILFVGITLLFKNRGVYCTLIRRIFFLLFGLFGLFLIYMWLATDHSATAINFNLLWANPLYLMLLIFYRKNKSFFKRKKIMTIIIFCQAILMLFFWFLPQDLNAGVFWLSALGVFLLLAEWNKVSRTDGVIKERQLLRFKFGKNILKH